MSHSQVIGQKVRNFRKDRGLSQLELETLIDASPGSISRIEKSDTNPTKETLGRIAKALSLNKFEVDHLVGTTHEPVSQEEINEVIDCYRDYMNNKGVLAYIIDERYRLIHISKDFPKFLGLSDEDMKNALGQSLIKVMLDPAYKVFPFINTSEIEDLLFHNFAKYYFSTHFMVGDKFLKDSINAINSNKIAQKVWGKINEQKPRDINTMQSRKVKFKLGKLDIDMWYSVELVSMNPRFEIIEYIPTNKILRLLTRIV